MQQMHTDKNESVYDKIDRQIDVALKKKGLKQVVKCVLVSFWSLL